MAKKSIRKRYKNRTKSSISLNKSYFLRGLDPDTLSLLIRDEKTAEAIRWIRNNGKRVNEYNNYDPPLFMAVYEGNMKILEELTKCNKLERDLIYNGCNILDLVTGLQRYEMFEFLINNGFDILLEDSHNRIRLLNFCINKNEKKDIFDLLCPYLTDEDGLVLSELLDNNFVPFLFSSVPKWVQKLVSKKFPKILVKSDIDDIICSQNINLVKKKLDLTDPIESDCNRKKLMNSLDSSKLNNVIDLDYLSFVKLLFKTGCYNDLQSKEIMLYRSLQQNSSRIFCYILKKCSDIDINNSILFDENILFKSIRLKKLEFMVSILDNSKINVNAINYNNLKPIEVALIEYKNANTKKDRKERRIIFDTLSEFPDVDMTVDSQVDLYKIHKIFEVVGDSNGKKICGYLGY